MKTLSITDAKHRLAELLQSAEPVVVTRRGNPIGTLNLRALWRNETTTRRHRLACRRLIALAESAPIVDDPEQGITSELRRLRDSGEIY
jgi:antitoxin (DNA-binding transcriptional repressor) of toxin-antitoxin stability system